MKLEGLIGKRFRRNKYGLTPWEKVIESVNVDRSLVVDVRKTDHAVKGGNYIKAIQDSFVEHGGKYRVVINGMYYLDEIIIYD